MFDFVSPEWIGISIAIAISVVWVSAICSGPWLVAFNEATGIITGKVFLDKCAYQMAKLWLYLAAMLILAIASQFYLLSRREIYLWEEAYRLPMLTLAALCAVALFLAAVHALSWKSLRRFKLLHCCLGFAAAICQGSALLLSGLLLRSLLHVGPPLAQKDSLCQQLWELFASVPLTSMIWPLIAQSFLLGLGAMGALSLVWTIILRNRDDFGRDYYNFVLPYSAYWAIIGTLGSLTLSVFSLYEGWKGMAPALSQIPPLWLILVTATLPVLACLIWIRIISSATPLRHKFGVWLALLLLILSIAAQILVANEIMPAS